MLIFTLAILALFWLRPLQNRMFHYLTFVPSLAWRPKLAPLRADNILQSIWSNFSAFWQSVKFVRNSPFRIYLESENSKSSRSYQAMIIRIIIIKLMMNMTAIMMITMMTLKNTQKILFSFIEFLTLFAKVKRGEIQLNVILMDLRLILLLLFNLSLNWVWLNLYYRISSKFKILSNSYLGRFINWRR